MTKALFLLEVTAPTLVSICPFGAPTSCVQNRPVVEDLESTGLHECISDIWRFKSLTQIEHLCVFNIVNDIITVWRLALLTLPDFWKVGNAPKTLSRTSLNKIYVVLKQHMFWFPYIKFREPSFSLLLCHWPPCQWHLSLRIFSVYISRCTHKIRKKLGIGVKLPTEKRRKKFGSENIIKLNLSCREAVKCFQILGEKNQLFGRKYLICAITFGQLLFCFVLPIADSTGCTIAI